MKRIISLILLSVLAVITVSCAPDANFENKDKETTAANEQNAADTTAAEEDKYGSLPEINMDGFELRFYNYDYSWMTWAINELDVEEQTGDLILDEIYKRNRRIEEKYNCNIIETTVGHPEQTLRRIVQSGDDLYDIAQFYDEYAVNYYTQGLLHTWDKIPYIEPDAPWWLQDANDVFIIHGRQFAAVGAFSLNMYSRTYVFLFNKDMVKNLGINENMYDLVRGGKWTLDKFAEIAKQAAADLNGDGIMNQNDRYGITTTATAYFGALVAGAGVKYIDIDEQGNPYFAIPGNMYALDVMQKIFDMNRGTDIYYKSSNDISSGGAVATQMFNDGQILFTSTSLRGIDHHNFKGMDIDIGILPIPKYNETQEKYHSLTTMGCVSVLPGSMAEDRFNNVGLLIEALSRDSYQSLHPIYKETTLKTKYSKDEDSEQMLDIVFDSITFDLGASVFPNETFLAYMDYFLNRNDSFVSATERLEPRVNVAINKLIQASETD